MKSQTVTGHTTIAVLVGAFLALIPARAPAQRAEPTPEALEGVGITEHLGVQIPLDLAFRDEDGRDVTLGDYFESERPVVLTLNYYACPMLCTLHLNGLVDALKELEWTPGQEFEIVTVSFDPKETPRLAKLKKQTYIKEYGRPAAASGWHFLTGDPQAIAALTDTLGFRYRYDEESRQFAHVAVTFVATPDGRVSRYLYGVLYEPKTIRLSLVEATDGRIGTTLDQVILYCFHYDAASGRYAPAAQNFMRAGGGLTVIVLGVLLVGYWRRDQRRKRTLEAGPSS